MITLIAQAWIPSMKRISYLIALLLIVALARVSAQETGAGGQAVPPAPPVPPAPVPTNQPPACSRPAR